MWRTIGSTLWPASRPTGREHYIGSNEPNFTWPGLWRGFNPAHHRLSRSPCSLKAGGGRFARDLPRVFQGSPESARRKDRRIDVRYRFVRRFIEQKRCGEPCRRRGRLDSKPALPSAPEEAGSVGIETVSR